ncbi:putative rossmann-like alpha/beta/alpha sandwich protein [Helianthus annuus]|nr:putative rossmann-like alpha/beta/alpha sandwich protein [Helianthus annuus]
MANTETEQKSVMIVGIDDSDHSFYALEWTLDHFLVPSAPNTPFKLIVVHSKPSPTSAIGFAGPGAADVYPFVDSDLKKIAARVAEKAKELCHSKSVRGFFCSLHLSRFWMLPIWILNLSC